MPINKKLLVNCTVCDTLIVRRKYEADKYSVRFCSGKCKSLYTTKSKKLNCSHCGIPFVATSVRISRSKSGKLFCSHSCSTIYKNQHKTTGIRRSKLEIWLESQLRLLYPTTTILFNDNTTINSELDIYFPELNLAVELNGIFHYEPIFGKDKLSQIQNNDSRKFQACLEQNIELMIIDTSSFKHFKEDKAKKYLDLITSVVNKK